MKSSYRNRGILFATAAAVSVLAVGCGGSYLEEQTSIKKDAIAEMESGDYKKASSDFESALSFVEGEYTPSDIDICIYQAAAKYLSGDESGAINAYTSIITSDNENAMAYYERGCIYLFKGDKEKALKDLTNAADKAGEDAYLSLRISEALSAAGETGRAESMLDDIIEKAGEEDPYTAAMAYIRKGDASSARKRMEALDQKISEAGEASAEADEENEEQAVTPQDEVRTLEYKKLQIDEECDILAGEYESALEKIEKVLPLDSEDSSKEKDSKGSDDAEDSGDSEDTEASGADNSDIPPHVLRALRRDQITALEFTGGFKDAKKLAKKYTEDFPDDASMANEYKFLKTR